MTMTRDGDNPTELSEQRPETEHKTLLATSPQSLLAETTALQDSLVAT